MTTFSHRDQALLQRWEKGEVSESDLEELLATEDLKEPIGDVIPFMQDIGAAANLYELDDYAVFGGYATLAHLADVYGRNIASKWRGSDDLDIWGNSELRHMITSIYDVQSEKRNTNFAKKWRIDIYTSKDVDHTKTLHIDYNEGGVRQQKEEIEFYGVPVNVFSAPAMIGTKAHLTNIGKHEADVWNLLGVCEQKGIEPAEIARNVPESNRTSLKQYLHEKRGSERIDLGPGRSYQLSLMDVLSDYRNL